MVASAASFAIRGDEAYSRDEDQEALGHSSQAVHLDPNNKKYRIQLGNVHVNLGDTAAAIREFGEAITDPIYRNDAQAKLDMIRKTAKPGGRMVGHDPA